MEIGNRQGSELSRRDLEISISELKRRIRSASQRAASKSIEELPVISIN